MKPLRERSHTSTHDWWVLWDAHVSGDDEAFDRVREDLDLAVHTAPKEWVDLDDAHTFIDRLPATAGHALRRQLFGIVHWSRTGPLGPRWPARTLCNLMVIKPYRYTMNRKRVTCRTCRSILGGW